MCGKTRENVVVLDFLAVDNFDFTRKIVKKILGEKLVKMLGFFVKIEFLDKNLTFRIVCRTSKFNCLFFWQVHYGCPIRLSRWQAGCLKLVTPHSPSIIATSMALLLMLLWSLPMSCPDLRSWLCKLLLMTKQAILPCIIQMLSIPRKFKRAIPPPPPPMTSITMGWTRTCLLLRSLLRRRQQRKAQSQQLQNRNSRSQQRIFQ